MAAGSTRALRLFTSESVTEGHPDKICDQVSDAVLDEALRQDPTSKVAVETVVTTGLVHIVGEMSTEAWVDIPSLVRKTVAEIGYTRSKYGFDAESCGISVSISEQSPEIRAGVETAHEIRTGSSSDAISAQGAGDQGIMFGYASNETSAFLPMPIWLAHRLSQRLAAVRKKGVVPYLRPDGKTQVTVGYDEAGVPREVDTVVVSAQHAPDISQERIAADVTEAVILPVLAESGLDHPNLKILVNPSGSFVLGGPMGDAGLTGRKIIVDTYGGMARHGGGAFSGKDPSKVDRSGAYATRWIAKNVVAAGLADRAEIQVAYAIGKAEPVGLYVDTFGTGTVPNETIVRAIREVFDLRPAAIIRDLDLLRPIYRKTAVYGHFGRSDDDFTWENLDRVTALAGAAGLG